MFYVTYFASTPFSVIAQGNLNFNSREISKQEKLQWNHTANKRVESGVLGLSNIRFTQEQAMSKLLSKDGVGLERQLLIKFGSIFKKEIHRWYRLNKDKNIIEYYERRDSKKIKGKIDLATIKIIQYAQEGASPLKKMCSAMIILKTNKKIYLFERNKQKVEELIKDITKMLGDQRKFRFSDREESVHVPREKINDIKPPEAKEDTDPKQEMSCLFALMPESNSDRKLSLDQFLQNPKEDREVFSLKRASEQIKESQPQEQIRDIVGNLIAVENKLNNEIKGQCPQLFKAADEDYNYISDDDVDFEDLYQRTNQEISDVLQKEETENTNRARIFDKQQSSNDLFQLQKIKKQIYNSSNSESRLILESVHEGIHQNNLNSTSLFCLTEQNRTLGVLSPRNYTGFTSTAQPIQGTEINDTSSKSNAVLNYNKEEMSSFPMTSPRFAEERFMLYQVSPRHDSVILQETNELFPESKVRSQSVESIKLTNQGQSSSEIEVESNLASIKQLDLHLKNKHTVKDCITSELRDSFNYQSYFFQEFNTLLSMNSQYLNRNAFNKRFSVQNRREDNPITLPHSHSFSLDQTKELNSKRMKFKQLKSTVYYGTELKEHQICEEKSDNHVCQTINGIQSDQGIDHSPNLADINSNCGRAANYFNHTNSFSVSFSLSPSSSPPQLGTQSPIKQLSISSQPSQFKNQFSLNKQVNEEPAIRLYQLPIEKYKPCDVTSEDESESDSKIDLPNTTQFTSNQQTEKEPFQYSKDQSMVFSSPAHRRSGSFSCEGSNNMFNTVRSLASPPSTRRAQFFVSPPSLNMYCNTRQQETQNEGSDFQKQSRFLGITTSHSIVPVGRAIQIAMEHIWNFQFSEAQIFFDNPIYSEDAEMILCHIYMLLIQFMSSMRTALVDNVSNLCEKGIQIVLDHRGKDNPFIHLSQDMYLSEVYLIKGALQFAQDKKIQGLLSLKNSYKYFQKCISSPIEIQNNLTYYHKSKLNCLQGLYNVAGCTLLDTYKRILSFLGQKFDGQKGIQLLFEVAHGRDQSSSQSENLVQSEANASSYSKHFSKPVLDSKYSEYIQETSEKSEIIISSHIATFFLSLYYIWREKNPNPIVNLVLTKARLYPSSPIYHWISYLIYFEGKEAFSEINRTLLKCSVFRQQCLMFKFEKACFLTSNLLWEESSEILTLIGVQLLVYDEFSFDLFQVIQKNVNLDTNFFNLLYRKNKINFRPEKIFFVGLSNLLLVQTANLISMSEYDQAREWLLLSFYFKKHSSLSAFINKDIHSLCQIYLKRKDLNLVRYEIMYFAKLITKVPNELLQYIQSGIDNSQDHSIQEKCQNDHSSQELKKEDSVERASYLLIKVLLGCLICDIKIIQECEANIQRLCNFSTDKKYSENSYLLHHSYYWIAKFYLLSSQYAQAIKNIELMFKTPSKIFSLQLQAENMLKEISGLHE